MKRGDFIIIGAVLVIAAALMGWQWSSRSGSGETLTAEIYRMGELYLEIPLTREEQVLHIETPYGENVILLNADGVQMLEADCPGQECIHMGAIHRHGQTIACLPNRVVVRLTGANREEYDAVAG